MCNYFRGTPFECFGKTSESAELENLEDGDRCYTTITYTNPHFKKKHLTQADIDHPDDRPVTASGCAWESFKLCCFLAAAFVFTWLLWEISK